MAARRRKREYYELFVDSAAVDWFEIAGKDPAAREEIEALARMDRIRAAFQDRNDDETQAAPPQGGRAQAPGGPAGRHDSSSKMPTFRHYTDLVQIGEGSFARIFKARNFQLGRDVAIKLLKSRAKLAKNVVARFVREARAMAKMRHENIVRIYDVLDEESVLGLCMELIDGQTLEEELRERKRLPADEVLAIGMDLCSALTEVHKAGFVHRDLKSENVMRERSGRIVLMDFGLAHSLDPDSRLTDTGIIVGTPIAMAPEQYQLQPLDARTDVYALGSLLYRLLTGAYPATGSSVEEIRDKILRGAFPRLDSLRPDVPKALGDVIRKAMETDPRKRFQNAAEMAAALAAIGNRTPAPAPASPVKAPGGLASKLGEPSRLVIGLLVAILMCLFAAVGLLIALIINKSS